MANECPVVLVHGLLGWGPTELCGFPYWGTGRHVPSPLTRHYASVGPLSSAHDRACELAFQIKGGTVDYGDAHSREAGHQRRGRAHAGFHPGWSAARPVHLVGHSMGGPTIWMLQHLLAIDAFGWGSDARWIKSISAISGVMNGSTATYFFGCSEETGRLENDDAIAFLVGAIEVFTAATGDLFDRVYDFDLDHWGFELRAGEPLRDYLERLCDGPFLRGTDNAAYSLTVQGLREQNTRCATDPRTYYFSYVTAQTFEGPFTGHHRPRLSMNPVMIPTATYIGKTRFTNRFYSGFRSEEWWENDGLVSTYSQMYPRSAGHHPLGREITAEDTSFEPGRWYHQMVPDTDHVDIVALPQLSQIGRQRRFYESLFARLAAL